MHLSVPLKVGREGKTTVGSGRGFQEANEGEHHSIYVGGIPSPSWMILVPAVNGTFVCPCLGIKFYGNVEIKIILKIPGKYA